MVKSRRILAMFMVLTFLSTLLVVAMPSQKAYASSGDRIVVSGSQFFAGSTRIWMNGANTPWHSWNDFGGSYDATWWGNHFAALRANGCNATRIWITCSGEVGINIARDGTVSGATAAHWSNLDSLFSLAQSNGIYIMATLISFDHFDRSNRNNRAWRTMITDSAKTDTFVNNYITPFVNRYKNNPYLWSIDLCNEPDWIYENASCGQIAWSNIQRYFAKAAVAIHANSSILVTVGMAMVKYNSDNSSVEGTQGNKVSDAALQALVADPRAKLDFWSPHHYDWMTQYWGDPFYMTPASYGMDTSRPSMIGENPCVGTAGHTLTEDYEQGYQNGWQGAQAWTSNGVDANGNFDTLIPATNAFKTAHPSLVFP
jgi:hypothetical protein